MNTLIKSALAFAAKNKAVFPCNTEKKPITPHGFKDATTDRDTIIRWWTQHPRANVGMPTGVVSNVVVLDVDMDAAKDINGEKALAALLAGREPLPDTLTIQTPRGGRHLYFQHPGGTVPCSTGKLGAGLDVRGDGGYVLLPPSRTEHGAYSYAIKLKPAPLPAWLRELLVNSAERPPGPGGLRASAPGATDTPGLPPSVGQAIEAGAEQGTQNARSFWIATQLRDEGHAQAAVEHHVLQFAARCRPPLSEREVRAAVSSAFKSAPREPARNPNKAQVEVVAHKVPEIASALDWRPFPDHLLPEPLASLVKAGSAAIGCDPAMIAVPALAAAAAAIGNARRIELKSSWREPSIVWSAVVCPSGDLKSPAHELAIAGLQDIQDREFARHKLAMTEWRAAVKAAKKAGDELPPEPLAVRHIIKDTSLAALALRLDENPRGLLLARDELSAWIGGFDRFDQAEEAAHWLEMHRAGPVTIDRKTGEPKTLHIPRASVSITGTIQPATLVRVLEQRHFDNGLAARLLLAMPPRRPRVWREAVVDSEILLVVQAMFTRLLALRPAADGKPLDLPLAPEAKARFVEFYNAHGAELQGLASERLAAAYSKLEGYAARLALVVECIRAAQAGDASQAAAVSRECIAAGIGLATWWKHETARIYGVLAETTDQRDARKVLEFVQAQDGRSTARDAARNGLCGEDTERIEALMEAMVQAGQGRWEPAPAGPKGGRPTRFFVVEQSARETDKTAKLPVEVTSKTAKPSDETAKPTEPAAMEGQAGEVSSDSRFRGDSGEAGGAFRVEL